MNPTAPRLWSNAAVLAAVLVVTGCGGSADSDAPGPSAGSAPAACAKVFAQSVPAAADTVVLVVDRTASVADQPMPAALAADLSEVSRRNGSLTVVAVDGDGAAPRILAKHVALSTSGERDRPSVERLATVIPACVAATYVDPVRPVSAGSDLYRAMAVAAHLLTPGTRLWTLTDLVPTAGSLALDDELVSRGAAAAGQSLLRAAPLDLKGVRWHVVGIGATSAALVPATQEWLRDLGRVLCSGWHATGCEALALDPVNPVRTGAAGLPADPMPAFPRVTRRRTGGGCTYTVPGSVSFAGDSADLRDDVGQLLGEPLRQLQQDPQARLVVVGHTASSARYDAAGLRTLSLRRADAVARWFHEQGVDQTRITTRGVGDTEPLAEDIDPTSGQQIESVAARERRVTLTVAGASC